MLTAAAAAAAALDARRVPDALAALRRAAGRLRPDLCPIAWAIIGLDAQGEKIASLTPIGDPNSTIRQGALLYEKLSGDDRRRVLRALAPRVADDLDAAWELMKSMPYGFGGLRRPFRARHPALTLWPRWYWLRSALAVVSQYDAGAAWFAIHAGYLPRDADTLGRLFAGAIDRGDGEVFDILHATARGDHPVAAMGRHVTRGLLSAGRPEGWAAVAGLLLAAQREEGLRQIILETADEARPDAFRLILRTVLDHNLTRFSAAVRAANTWLGFRLDAENSGDLGGILHQTLRYLNDRAEREWAAARGNGREAYLALWAMAFDNIDVAAGTAEPLLSDADPERRFAAAYLLGQMQLHPASTALLPCLADDDLRLVACTCDAWRQTPPRDAAAFDALAAALPRLPKTARPLPPILWPWLQMTAARTPAADLLLSLLGDRPPQQLIPHLSLMSPWARGRVANQLGAAASDPVAREALFALLADRGSDARDEAFKALSAAAIRPADAPQLEAYLSRGNSDTRRAALSLLAGQPAGAALASADRLLAARDEGARLGGLELLGLLARDGKGSEVQARAAAYRAARATLSPAEAAQLDALLPAAPAPAPALDDALGLAPPAGRTTPAPPRPLAVLDWTPATAACLKSLDALIHTHRDTPLPGRHGDGETLLGNTWAWTRFREPDLNRTLAEDLPNFFLREVWEAWWAGRGPECRDEDGLELLRAWLSSLADYYLAFPDEKPQRIGYNYPDIARRVLAWLIRLNPPSGGPDAALDLLESACRVRRRDVATRPNGAKEPFDAHKAYRRRLSHYAYGLRFYRRIDPAWGDAHHARFYRLLRWIDEPPGHTLRARPEIEDVLLAYRAGGATLADIYDQLLGARVLGWGFPFRELHDLSVARPRWLFADYPVLNEVMAAIRERVLEVEVTRGDLPTAATAPALALQAVYGATWLVRLLTALGGDYQHATHFFHPANGRSETLSHLLRVCLPADADTPERTAELLRRAALPARALAGAGLFAPQWAAAVELALGWPGYADAAWWIHGHSHFTSPAAGQAYDIGRQWQEEIAARTSLPSEELGNGAADVAWFRRVYAALGEARWREVAAHMRHARRGDYKRAALFADALLGRITRADLEKRILTKRHQDSVRALGLLPLPPADREAELLSRYQVIQAFRRGSRQFGPQRRENEGRAAQIALENLARAAGYPDPLRLTWAMEGREMAEWLSGPLSAAVGDVTVRLVFDEVGAAELLIDRAGRKLKSIPAAARKDPAVVDLLDRRRAIAEQQKRMRPALEGAMCREEIFLAGELRQLLTHPTLAPMLAQLVWMGASEAGAACLGYPVDGGRALQGHDGRRRPLTDDTPLRVAHPYDLWRTGEWHLWQRECFRAERIQPFKQVFRELYLLTPAESAAGHRSRRYAGQQVRPRQALALLTGRGWIARHEEGIRRAFPDRALTAVLESMVDWLTPAEVEGATLESVFFTRPDRWWEPLPLDDVPPLVFSEVMRDLDLVVSVAHSAGVDPEASASSLETRAALLRETADLLRLANVRLEGQHALIEGKLSSYAVHLGSGVVHRRPGGAVCIIPVHSQHRGRLFLPFADDDPKTAEVISKVLLLARDDQIKDPGILEQLLA